MAYDEKLATRVRTLLKRKPAFTERKMFGGIAFMLRGHMCCGVLNDDLVVRVAPRGYADALAQPHVRPMDFTGRALKGFVYVGRGGWRTDRALAGWVRHGVNFVASLPAKPVKPRTPPRHR